MYFNVVYINFFTLQIMPSLTPLTITSPYFGQEHLLNQYILLILNYYWK